MIQRLKRARRRNKKEVRDSKVCEYCGKPISYGRNRVRNDMTLCGKCKRMKLRKRLKKNGAIDNA